MEREGIWVNTDDLRPCVCPHACMCVYRYVHAHVCECLHVSCCVYMLAFVYAHSVFVHFLEGGGNRTVSRFPKCSNPSLSVRSICMQ